MKKVKNNKSNKNKKTTVIVCVVLVLAIIVSAIAWITRDKTNGVFSPLGFKMNGENILSLTVDIGDGKQEYLVPFSEYRAVYLYYANRISNVIQYDEENFAQKRMTCRHRCMSTGTCHYCPTQFLFGRTTVPKYRAVKRET